MGSGSSRGGDSAAAQTIDVLVEAMPESAVLIDATGTILAINTRLAARLGRRREELIGSCVYDLFPAEVARARREVASRVLATGETVYTDDTRDGRRLTSTVYPLLDDRGSVVRMLVLATDSSDVVQAEKALRLQRDAAVLLGASLEPAQALQGLLGLLLRHAPLDCGGIYDVDATSGAMALLVHDGLSPRFVARVRHCAPNSPQAEVVRGGAPRYFSQSEIDGTPHAHVAEEGLRALAVVPFCHGGRTTGCLNLGSRSEPIIPVTVRSALEGVASQIGGFFARQQIERERATLQEQLLQAQKMEAIGTLAGGVAHEMNNILAVILGLASLLRDMTAEADDRIVHLRSVLAAAERGRSLTQNLLGFSRKSRPEAETVALNPIIREQVVLLSQTARKDLAIACELAADLPAVCGDRHQLAQVLMNLCLNAIDAMPEGGRILIRTYTEPAPAGETRSQRLAGAGGSVCLAVGDNGVGMPAEVVTRIFEPFFTTKEPGKGTGLGLAVVYRIVTDHGGRVVVDSAPGQGTTVTVRLPATRAVAASLPEPAAALTRGHGRGTVLFVDDEELLRATGRAMLEQLGFSVLLAANGREAVEIFEHRHREIDLVLLDLAMPVLDGLATLPRLRQVDAEVKVILCSGYLDGQGRSPVAEQGASAYLSKPFDMHQLDGALAGVLRGAR